MVGTLKIRHPEFARRLQEAAQKAGVSIKQIEKQLPCKYEMARRYWNGYAIPRPKLLSKLADLLHISSAYLQYGEKDQHAVKEASPPYPAMPTEAAIQIARAWEKLSPAHKVIYRNAIFKDAAIETLMPWLQVNGRPAAESYDAFERAVERDYRENVKQMDLDLG